VLIVGFTACHTIMLAGGALIFRGLTRGANETKLAARFFASRTYTILAARICGLAASRQHRTA